MEQNPIADKFKAADALLRGLVTKRNPLSVIFARPPGVGKSLLLRNICEEYGHEWRPIRPSSKKLIVYLDEDRYDRTPLIFDDFDNAFRDSQLIQIFKIVLDSHDTRILSNDVRGQNNI